MGIDWELWLRLSTRYKFHHVDESLLYYRIWEGQMSHKWKLRYQWADHIMTQFIRDFPDAVSDKAIRLAYADTYTARGKLYLARENDRDAAWADFKAALEQVWHYRPAWKAILTMYLLPWRYQNAG